MQFRIIAKLDKNLKEYFKIQYKTVGNNDWHHEPDSGFYNLQNAETQLAKLVEQAKEQKEIDKKIKEYGTKVIKEVEI